MTHWLDVAGCPNLRDIGAFVPGLRSRVVYRSSAVRGEVARRLVDEYGVRSLVDLRMPDEVRAAPVEIDARVVHIPTENPDPAQLKSGEMGELYLWNLEPRATTFVDLLAVLADPANLACVIQCSGGKDRTGILVALLLRLLDVDDETIVAEYALTDEAFERVPAEERQARIQSTIDAGYDPEVLRARPATMQRFLAGFRDAYGTAEVYAKSAGATDATIAAVRANLRAS